MIEDKKGWNKELYILVGKGGKGTQERRDRGSWEEGRERKGEERRKGRCSNTGLVEIASTRKTQKSDMRIVEKGGIQGWIL